MKDPTIIQLIPKHEDETCVKINDEGFDLLAWALVAGNNGNEIVPVILFDGKPLTVYGYGDGWRVQPCSSIPRKKPLLAPLDFKSADLVVARK